MLGSSAWFLITCWCKPACSPCLGMQLNGSISKAAMGTLNWRRLAHRCTPQRIHPKAQTAPEHQAVTLTEHINYLTKHCKYPVKLLNQKVGAWETSKKGERAKGWSLQRASLNSPPPLPILAKRMPHLLAFRRSQEAADHFLLAPPPPPGLQTSCRTSVSCLVFCWHTVIFNILSFQLHRYIYFESTSLIFFIITMSCILY